MFVAGIELFLGLAAGAMLLIALFYFLSKLPILASSFVQTVQGRGSVGATVVFVLFVVVAVSVAIWIANGTIH